MKTRYLRKHKIMKGIKRNGEEYSAIVRVNICHLFSDILRKNAFNKSLPQFGHAGLAACWVHSVAK